VALLVKACPHCLARVFHGHRHCPECGFELEVPAAGLGDAPPAPRACPRCHEALVAHLVGDIALDDCPRCGGTFVDRVTLERLLGERREARAEAILGAFSTGGDGPLPTPPGPLYVKCPDCGGVMNRKQFARGSHVIVDVCRSHGSWFDAHELPRIVRFVEQGGLERAAQQELAEEKERARRMMAQARAAQREAVRAGVSSGIDRGSLLADLLIDLWK
jgi:Zn-finger nucleic acid-binding protein